MIESLLLWLLSLVQTPEPEEPTVITFGKELPSPKSRIVFDKAMRDTLQIELEAQFGEGNIYFSRVGSSNSMEPLIDDNCRCIMLKVSDPSDLSIGDVIIYDKDGVIVDHNYDYDDVIHSIISIDSDGERYFTTKGLHNPVADSLKIRDNMVISVLIGVIWVK